MQGNMSKKSAQNIREKAVKAALALAAAQGWLETSMADIAKKAKISMADMHDHFEDRFDILAAYGRIIDKKIMEAVGNPDPDLSPRDRLFDIMMERFDVLNEERDGVCAILRSFCFDPKQAVISLPHLGRSMSWMLEASGIETGGYKGAIKVMGLTGLYLKTLKTWKDDDSEDMAKTMAELDKNLGRAEKWAESFGLSNNVEN